MMYMLNFSENKQSKNNNSVNICTDMFKEYPDILGVNDLKEMLNIGRNSALTLLQNKTIKSFRIGKCYKIPKISVIGYINSQI